MSNIAISELDTTASTLENDDLLLVSKKNGDSFTSAKMPGSVLKGSSGSCNFSSDAVKTACTSALNDKSVSTLTSSQVQSACSSAISATSISAGMCIDGTKTDGFICKPMNSTEVSYTLQYDSVITFYENTFNTTSAWSNSIYMKINDKVIGTSFADTKPDSGLSRFSGPLIYYVKKGTTITFHSDDSSGYYSIAPLG